MEPLPKASAKHRSASGVAERRFGTKKLLQKIIKKICLIAENFVSYKVKQILLE